MIAVHTGDKLDKEIKNLADCSIMSGHSARLVGSLESGLSPQFGAATDATLEQMNRELKDTPPHELFAKFKGPSIENIKAGAALKLMSTASFGGETPQSVRNLLAQAAFMPTDDDLREHIASEVRRNTIINGQKERQNELDKLMKPKTDKFDLLYSLAKEQFSLLSDVEKANNIISESITASKVPSQGLYIPMRQAVAANEFCTFISGSLPLVLLFKLICVKVSHTRVFKEVTKPIKNDQSRPLFMK